MSASQLLDVWEGRHSAQPFQRAQALLETAFPDAASTDLADLPIGERDGRLLALRERTFGPHISAVSTCATCAASLEVAFRTSDIAVSPPGNGASHLAELNGFAVEFRVPNGRDLAEVDPRTPEADLLGRCTIAARHGGEPIDPGELPGEVIEAVVAGMAEADPQAHVEIEVACPNCGESWQTPFDVVSFFWTEIDAWARRTLREVHALASAYGWREADILAMSPRRRQLYLEHVG